MSTGCPDCRELHNQDTQVDEARYDRDVWHKAYTKSEALNSQYRALIARVVVVMDGSWDVLGTGEEEQLYKDLHAVVFRDIP